MTTGPQHYAEAERLLATRGGTTPRSSILAEAQVHATLALAAATALSHRETSDDENSYSVSVLPSDDYDAWWRAASEGPATQARRRAADEAEELAAYRGQGADFGGQDITYENVPAANYQDGPCGNR